MAYNDRPVFPIFGNIYQGSKSKGEAIDVNESGSSAYAYVNISVATGDDAQGHRNDSDFYPCVVSGSQAENLARSVRVGDPVLAIVSTYQAKITKLINNREVEARETRMVVRNIGPSLKWGIATYEPNRAPDRPVRRPAQPNTDNRAAEPATVDREPADDAPPAPAQRRVRRNNRHAQAVSDELPDGAVDAPAERRTRRHARDRNSF